MSTAAPIQVDCIAKVHRKCWRNRLYQIWSTWRLLDPIGLIHVHYTVEYARSRELGYYAQKAVFNGHGNHLPDSLTDQLNFACCHAITYFPNTRSLLGHATAAGDPTIYVGQATCFAV